jgi:hypothetical protein
LTEFLVSLKRLSLGVFKLNWTFAHDILRAAFTVCSAAAAAGNGPTKDYQKPHGTRTFLHVNFHILLNTRLIPRTIYERILIEEYGH